MIPYRLMLVSNSKPDTPQGIFCSAQMLGWGLWEEFSKLPHVTLTYQNAEEPLKPHPVDFTLLLCYFAGRIYSQMREVRAMTSRRIINFMELGHPPETLIDYNFTYLPHQCHWGPSEQIEFPYVGSLLSKSVQEKWSGSVLLDHSWPISLLRGPQELWYNKLYPWLEPLKDSRKIGQLRRTNVDIDPDVNWKLKSDPIISLQGRKLADAFKGQIPVPDWVQSIPECCYPEYLERTAPYENFVLTHPGSYEHSIIDMAARGIKVLVPVQDGRSFIPRALVNRLGFPTFETKEELYALLDAPNSVKRDFGTDMPEIVRRIDKYCQREMKK